MDRRGVPALALGFAAGLLAGCTSPPYPLPDRAAADVRAEEERLAGLLPRPLLDGPGTCRVRLLGRDGAVSYAWAHCTGPAGAGGAAGVSVPVRVEGDAVGVPEDGAGYPESVRRLFPHDLAEAVLDDPDRLRP
ncbi:hypothetical protein [Micromonospora sp. WMMD812]|uniref:hypothetical protein n=1 Tax=Micromonospora sp. WMMD812 TaxID=3015152 RepID=UPI00248C8EC0|nr:hypothetical protein [Micromonospora sp. WMMD812]WBB69522.1 hypothetical protein O7603_09280 [Micromonospora sp. WMMD812]